MRFSSILAAVAASMALAGCPNNGSGGSTSGGVGGSSGFGNNGGGSSSGGTSTTSSCGLLGCAASGGSSTGAVSTSSASTTKSSSGGSSTGAASSASSTTVGGSSGSTGAASTVCGLLGCGHTGGPSSSSTSGGGSTGGSTTGGSTGAVSTSGGGSSGGIACNAAGGSGELFSCTLNSDCACPYQCLVDQEAGLGGTYCEQPCTTTADCTDTFAVCRGGACNVNICGPDPRPDAGPNGVYSGACNAADAGDGTCYADYQPDAGNGPFVLWVCYQGGPATGACDANADRGSDPSGLCAPGSLCFSNDGGAAGTCTGVCDPLADSGTCPTGSGCAQADLEDNAAPDWGVCFPNGTGNQGQCINSGIDNETYPCGPNAQCGCVAGADIECFADPALATNVYGGLTANGYGTDTFCERLCNTTSDCPLPYEACVNHWCSYNFCGNTTTGVGMSAPCSAADAGDGTCDPIPNGDDTGVAFGICFQSGPATDFTECDPSATRTSDPAGLCVQQSLCFDFGASSTPEFQCVPVCNPDAGGGDCSASTICAPSGDVSPDLGLCIGSSS